MAASVIARIIEKPTTELWNQIAAQCSYSTFFHRWTWAQIVVESFPEFHIATKAFALDDGATAIVPMVATTERNGYFKHFESIFPGSYGGAIAERELTSVEIEEISCRLLGRDAAYIHIMGNPYSARELASVYDRTTEFTHVLRLSKGFDALSHEFSDEKKRHIRRAQKLGVEVGVAQTEAEYLAYYQVYKDSLRRWGDKTLVTYPYELFKHIYQRRDDSIRLWVAKINGEIVSGNLSFYHNQHAVYWHGATLERYFPYHPAPLVTTEIIRDACTRGFTYYDFNPSGGLAGVEHYKEGFGARKKYFFSYTWKRNALYDAYHKIRGSARKILPRTTVPN